MRAPRYARGVTDMQADQGRQERWTVDGIEDSPRGPLARIEREGGQTFDLPLRALPAGVREGDVLSVEDGPGAVTVRRLPAQTQARREQAQRRLDALNMAPTDEEEITL